MDIEFQDDKNLLIAYGLLEQDARPSAQASCLGDHVRVPLLAVRLVLRGIADFELAQHVIWQWRWIT